MTPEQLPRAILTALDDASALDQLPRQVAHSRAQMYRLFQALLQESPGAMRRRFLLERSAWQLQNTRAKVTEIALDAAYGSLEAFTRAFAAAYGASPSIYRRTGIRRIHLPAPNAYHYAGPQHTVQPQKGTPNNMDLFDLFQGTDSWYTRKLLAAAAQLTPEQLDQQQPTTVTVFGWDKPDENLREILERMVLTKELWTAAFTGSAMPELFNPPPEERTPQRLCMRFERADAEFNRVLQDIRDRNAWDDTFVDALCDPPEKFTFGGMFAHVVTFNAQRRMAAIDAFYRLGAPISGIGCPMEYAAAVEKP